MSADAKLLPCPFCGATPHRGLGKVWRDSLHGDRHQYYVIKCPHLCVTMTGTAEGVVERWNTRTPHPAPVTAREAEPVAWRYRSISDPGMGWTKVTEFRRDRYARVGMEEQPLYTHPPQPSETVAEAAKHALDACRIIDAAVLEGHDNVSDLICHLLEAVEPARAALRALSSGEASRD